MSTNTDADDGWYANVGDRDYWELDYLKLLKREQMSGTAQALVVVASVLVLIGLVMCGLHDPTWAAWLNVGSIVLTFVAGITAGFGALMSFVLYIHLADAVSSDNRAGRSERRELAERVRLFALKVEQEFGFLLTIKGFRPGVATGGTWDGTYSDDREKWALDHARQIREEWPNIFARYRKLKANVNYERVLSDLFDTPGHVRDARTIRYEEIVRSMQDMWDRLSRTLKVDRATIAIDRDGTIETEKEIKDARIRDIADGLKKPGPPPPTGAEDL